MKKVTFALSIFLITTVTFSQNKPKTMRELRDSIFTVMKLTDENRLKMHNLIVENSNGQKAIKQDLTITFGAKKEKMDTWKKEMTEKEKSILTAEQFLIWRDFGKSLNSNPKQ